MSAGERLRIGSRVTRLDIGPANPVWEPSGARVAIEEMGEPPRRVTGIYSTANWERLTQLNARRPAWSPDGTQLACVDPDGNVQLYRASDLMPTARHVVGTNSVGWDGDTPVAYTGAVVRIEGQTLREIDACVDGCIPLRWCPAGGLVLVTRTHGNVQAADVLDLRSGRPLASLGASIEPAVWSARARAGVGER